MIYQGGFKQAQRVFSLYVFYALVRWFKTLKGTSGIWKESRGSPDLYERHAITVASRDSRESISFRLESGILIWGEGIRSHGFDFTRSTLGENKNAWRMPDGRTVREI